jgi:hypothetical protein
MPTLNRPVSFNGTEDERLANRATHDFVTYHFGEDSAETECFECCAKPWHTFADYPCGQQPPRETIIFNNPSLGA